MKIAGKFEKVSFEQFEKDWMDTGLGYDNIKEIYDSIKLPKRATKGSAGYDFFMPIDYNFGTQRAVKIPTGIRAIMNDGWVLKLYPRSGLGFKYAIKEANTVGIIDQDYYYSDNEGHIFVKLVNNDPTLGNIVHFKQGDGFCQGIFLEYGITEDDVATGKRNGGFGSTDNSK